MKPSERAPKKETRADIDPKFIRLARQLAPKNPMICDIGSRDGLEGIALMLELESKELHVFEPNPAAAAVCRKNLQEFAENRPELVYFWEFAVSDKTGLLKFYPVNVSRSENKDVGFSSLYPINPDYTKRRGSIVQDEITVKTVALDEYFLETWRPDILWVDVEGAELQVFHGAKRVLETVKLIHVEVSFRPMQVGKPLFWEIERYLREQGFRFHSFMEISPLRSFLYRHKLLPNLPWRLNAVFYRP
jgi:FkbM family methyltransferase